MTQEDPKIAADLVAREMKQFAERMRDGQLPVQVVAFEDQSDWPEGDGGRMFGPVTIGVRGELTKRDARRAAAVWHAATRRYPKAVFMINLLGYNEDPREIWDIPEAARYVRRWARFAGLSNPRTAERYALDAPDMDVPGIGSVVGSNVSFLAACGVFGDNMKAAVLRNHRPPIQSN